MASEYSGLSLTQEEGRRMCVYTEWKTEDQEYLEGQKGENQQKGGVGNKDGGYAKIGGVTGRIERVRCIH